MDPPFRAEELAMAGRIEQLERDLAQTRSELAQVLATIPENGDAYTRRLVEENAELHADCARLGREIAGMQAALAAGKQASP